ncbi:hypothetical protein NLG97_g2078 [Lecanicillium saksenae]|uniref:Uncharacterized protein n=1 Tax=Lecanicillium saksenae TaxID=468837 RepID=A0ACC1R4L3_9HYPO|nr:hypothetical protein NLG97_g2078 [Lecanicillium saksenae]
MIAVLSAIILGLLTYMEHRRSVYPSSFLALILVADIVHGAVVSNFAMLEGTYLAGATVALKVVLVSLHSTPKKQSIIDQNLRRNFDDKVRTGLLDLLSYLSPSNLSSMSQILYRSRVFLQEEDQLEPDLEPVHLLQQLKAAWAYQQLLGPIRGGSLFIACLKAWKHSLLSLLLSRLTLTALRWVHPLVLHRLIDAVARQYDDSYDTTGRLTTFLSVAAVFFASAAAEENFSHLMGCYLARLRGGLIALQLDKLQRLTVADAKKSASVTLITSDIDGITNNISNLMMIPICLLEVGIGCSFLSRTIGSPPFVLCLPFLVTSAVNYLIRGTVLKHFKSWNESESRRISSTSKILQQLMSIKMLGLGPTISEFLQALRIEELQISKPVGVWISVSTIFLFIADYGLYAVTIAVAISSNYFAGGMTADRLFPLLLITENISACIPNISEFLIASTSIGQCFHRIQTFLCLQESSDCRIAYDSTITTHPAPGLHEVICFNHADIAAQRITQPLLRRVNIALTQGSVSGVVGPHGAGKSTFLRAILGECEVLGGSVQVDGEQIGYCGEEVWLQEATIRQNIVGILPFDEQRYRTVIRACFLEEDFEQLPGGDNYIVQGSNLSDGQKLRIGIARAAYARHSITLLDDVFRSLDIETAICILHQLCGRNSIFRQAGCTVVVVTSLPQCLEVVDQLIVLDGQGHATLDRTYRSAPHRPRFERALRTLNINNNALLVVEKRQQHALYRYLQANSIPDRPQAAGIRRVSDWQLVLFTISEIGRLQAILYSFLILCFSASESVPKLYLRFWVDTHPDDFSLYLNFTSVCAACSVVPFVAYFVTGVILSPRLSIRFYNILVQTIGRSTIGFFEVADPRQLSTLFNGDSLAISRKLSKSLLRIMYAGFALLFLIGIIVLGNSYTVWTFPFIIALVIYQIHHFCSNWREVRQLEIQKQTALSTFFEETATGLTQLSSSFLNDQQLENGMNILAESQISLGRRLMITTSLRFTTELFTAILMAILLAPALFTQGASTTASIGLAYRAAISVGRVLYETIIAFGNLDTALEAVGRLLELKEQTPLENLESCTNLPPDWPSSGAIDLHNAFAYYTPSVDSVPAVSNISLSIMPGQHLGISGRSNSGKSSLFLMMLGFIRYEGVAKIDGIDISSISPETLRSRLITITQEPVIFEGTVRANLLPLTLAGDDQCWKYMYGEAKDAELEDLLKRLHIWMPLISKGGLDAIIDDVDYSKAEMQLLCIARAILRQRETGTKVILVDDATSCLTLRKEKIANEVMSACFRGCTVLRISARQSGLEGVSSAIYLSRGTVVDPDQIGNESESELETDSDAEVEP